jgi:hypothetical protein
MYEAGFVRKGGAGKPSLLNKLAVAFLFQAYLTFFGAETCGLLTIISVPDISALALTNTLLLPAISN